MAEGKNGRKLSRTKGHRKALMSNMATSLLQYEQITTTQAKAKELRKVVERLITLSKKGDLSSRRLALRTLRDKKILKKLFDTLGERFKERKGGYTSIIKIPPRKGDAAPQAIIRLL
ncbi:MAG: 50S ribosomal protein L17 [bacterium]